MQIIHSNPWGFGIHSPYVYRLVTRGLFGRNRLLYRSFKPEWHLNFRQEKKLYRILNLIEFFKTCNIQVTDQTGFPGFHIMEILLKDIAGDNDRNHRFSETSPRITIDIDPLKPLPEISQDDIWITTDLQLQDNQKLFRDMQSSPLVSISVESCQLGVIIFNSSFQKQHYHIHSWFYLC